MGFDLETYLVSICFLLQDHPAVLEDLDLVEEEDQFTHLLTLEDAGDPENMLSMSNVFVNLVYKAKIVLLSLVPFAYINIVLICLVFQDLTVFTYCDIYIYQSRQEIKSFLFFSAHHRMTALNMSALET